MTTVMIIDDSTMIRMQVRRALLGAGYVVLQASDGQDALEKLAVEVPDIIVCDVNMPRMNGLELLEELPRSPGRDVPVVMLTTEGQPEFIRKARLLGAKGWLVKPFKPDLLLAVVAKITKMAV